MRPVNLPFMCLTIHVPCQSIIRTWWEWTTSFANIQVWCCQLSSRGGRFCSNCRCHGKFSSSVHIFFFGHLSGMRQGTSFSIQVSRVAVSCFDWFVWNDFSPQWAVSGRNDIPDFHCIKKKTLPTHISFVEMGNTRDDIVILRQAPLLS